MPFRKFFPVPRRSLSLSLSLSQRGTPSLRPDPDPGLQRCAGAPSWCTYGRRKTGGAMWGSRRDPQGLLGGSRTILRAPHPGFPHTGVGAHVRGRFPLYNIRKGEEAAGVPRGSDALRQGRDIGKRRGTQQRGRRSDPKPWRKASELHKTTCPVSRNLHSGFWNTFVTT